VEQTAGDDARAADVIWDDDSDVYRIAYCLDGEDVVVTRMTATQGSVSHATLADGSAGDAFDQPSVAARESGGEHMAVYRVNVASDSDLSLNAHFVR
jgi:hypothetical protein